MAPYVQTCSCAGKAVALQRDLDRIRSEAAQCRLQASILKGWRMTGRADGGNATVADLEELSIDILGWHKEAARNDKKALRVEIRIAGLPTGACSTCAGAGVITGNGSAQLGGMTRKRATI
jgi:hypothetical protein